MIDSLEARRLFSVSAAAYGQTLYVWGDNGSNGISVESSRGQLVVKTYQSGSGYQPIFTASDAYVKAIRVYGFAGADTISIDDAVTDPAVVYGGKGADYLKGGGGPTELWGHGNAAAGDPDHGPASDDGAADTTVSGKGYALHHGQKGDDTLITDDTGDASDYDVMFGGPGFDTFYINGGGKRAYAYGEGDKDVFIPKQSATQTATLYGGPGEDVVNYSEWTSGVYVQPSASLYSGSRYGERRQLIRPDVEVVVGTEQADYFWGSDGDESFEGGGGNDKMYGNGGDDFLQGGSGHDQLYGGDGDDFIHGDDFLNGPDGNDVIYGGAGDDEIYGDGGNDVIYGEAGDDHLDAGVGNDAVHGGAGDDYVYGGEGNDLIYGDAGRDWLIGGYGSDYIVSHDGVFGNDEIEGDSGADSFPGDHDIAFIDQLLFVKDKVKGVESVSS